MTFWPHPKVTSLILGYLHSVLIVIPVDLIWHITMFEKKMLTPWAPQRPQRPTPGDWPRRQNVISRLICFVSFICENTHKAWYKNLWNLHGNRNSMIFDLLISPQGHQLDHRMKILLSFGSARHPHRFDMPHEHVWKKNLTAWATRCPRVPPLGHDPGDRIKIPSDMFYIFHLWEHTQSFV